MNKILLVEDDADITANLQTFLAKEGFEVDCADGQKKAFEMLDHGTYDLVLLNKIRK